MDPSRIEGQTGVGVSAYALVASLRAALGKPANREEDSRSFNKLKESRPLLQSLQPMTITRRGGSIQHQTPALSTLEQVHAVIDSKSYVSIAADFKAQHLAAIISMLPTSAGVPAVQQRQQPLPPYLEALDGVTRGAAAHQYTCVAPDYPAFRNFLDGMQAAEGTHFNMIHREEQAGCLVVKLSCHFGGKPKWEERKSRATQQPTDFKRAASAGHSIKVECPATISARIPLPYAQSLGMLKAAEADGAHQEAVADRRIRITMSLGHCGHQPNTALDLNSLPLDAR